MKEQSSALPEEGPEGARNPVSLAQSEFTGERSSWKATQDIRCGPSKGMQHHWEAQWQEFLKTLQSPHSAWGSPQLAETTLWDDAKAFLTSFEQVAKACQWPREEWVARLLPALSGEAQQAFSSLEARDREDYGRVKAAILRGEANRMEALRQHFRQFRSREVEDPHRIYSQLQELCHRWLKPERHSKEQILELLVLEQFLAILPVELQSWIRAGGPENCTQAAALVDDFLLSQQKVETWKWQEPLQEMIRGSLVVEGAPSDFEQRRVVKETKENSGRDTGLLGSQMTCPNDSEISLPPKEQDATKPGLKEAPVTLKETGMSLHVVEPALPKPGQRTMFWQVMQEDEGNADSLEGLLVPKSDLASHLEKDNEMFTQFPEESERLSSRDPGDGKRSQIKVKGSDQGECGPKVAHGTVAVRSQGFFPETSEIHKQRCESRRPPKKSIKEEKEHCQITAVFPSSSSKTETVDPEQKRSLFSKYGRRYRFKSGLALMRTREIPDECPREGENVPQKDCTGEKQCEVSQYFKQDCRVGPQSNPPGGKPYQCPDCGKCFSSIWSLKKHQAMNGEHTEWRPYECVQCGKCFSQREHMKKHCKLHSGGLHECPKCGKNFTRQEALTRHMRIHTGEKPYGCPQCGRFFRQKEHFVTHQRIHTGEKPFVCSRCERRFSRRDALLRHQRIHRKHNP